MAKWHIKAVIMKTNNNKKEIKYLNVCMDKVNKAFKNVK